jgi:hypothetical protein
MALITKLPIIGIVKPVYKTTLGTLNLGPLLTGGRCFEVP